MVITNARTSRALAAAVAGLAAAGCAKSGPTSAPGTTTATSGDERVEISSFAFLPDELTVPAGTAVTWTNLDATVHSVKSEDGTLDSPDFTEGKSYTATLSVPGTYSYVCGIHPYMSGTISVST